MFTPEILKALKKPFSLDEHRFLQGNPYILKQAIRDRLSEVDPAWSTTPPEIINVHGDSIVLRGGLTVCEITRYSIGTGIVNSTRKRTDDVDGKKITRVAPLEGYDLAREQNKAYKAADSDLLPRCAVEFGVGAYLKDRPRGQSEGEFPQWLNGLLSKYHWAYNGAGKRFGELLKAYGLQWNDVNSIIEPGRTLRGLSDISLDEITAFVRLDEIVAGMQQGQ